MYIKTTKDLADELERDEALLRGVAARLRRTARTCSEAHGHLQRQEADALDRILSALAKPEGEPVAWREALEPFAAAAACVPADQEDFKVVAYVPAGHHADAFNKMAQFLTAGNFRRLAALNDAILALPQAAGEGE